MRIAYTRPDGGASIVIAAPKKDLERVLGPLSDAEYRAHVMQRSIPADATDIKELPDNWTPPDKDRTFRNAWKHSGGQFSVDMEKARDIHRERIRQARESKMAALDVAYQRADEKADSKAKADISAKKQALRDLPADPAIEAAKTPDELRAFWPDSLK